MGDLVEFRYPETVSMLRRLRASFGQEVDLAHDIHPQHWHDRYLKGLPDDLRCTIDAPNGSISRDMLYGLADDSWQRRDDRQALSKLFWNILAWGISGDWRRVQSVRDAIIENPERAMEGLRSAQVASREGRLNDAFNDTRALIPRWGPAFTTKFLAFTADRSSEGPQAIVIDSRVQLAWSILIEREGMKDLTAKRYERMCTRAADLAHRHGLLPSELEESLFLFGQKVGDYERWTTALLAGISVVPSATAVIGRLLADDDGSHHS